MNVAAQANSVVSDDVHREWNEYKKEYGKSYNEKEDKRRLKIFLKNKIMFEKHNVKYVSGEVSWRIGINQFADMTPEEVVKNYTGLRIPSEERLN